jgi:hypothetical protein
MSGGTSVEPGYFFLPVDFFFGAALAFFEDFFIIYFYRLIHRRHGSFSAGKVILRASPGIVNDREGFIYGASRGGGMKNGVTLALILTFSPRRRDSVGTSWLFEDPLANPALDILKTRKQFLLLLGEKAGMREDNNTKLNMPFSCLIFFAENMVSCPLAKMWRCARVDFVRRCRTQIKL